MKIIIDTANNGFLVSVYGAEDCDGNSIESRAVFVNTEDCSVNALYDMLWEIVELIGDGSNRYSDHRIMISCIPGDKVEHTVRCSNQHWVVEDYLDRRDKDE